MTEFDLAILFANGEAQHGYHLPVTASDWLVAVDGGLRHILDMGRVPHLLIGDLDSVDPDLIEHCVAAGVDVLRYPPEKDKTDLELALDQALARGFDEIIIACALGSRIDHTLGNLSLLTRPDLGIARVALDDGKTRVILLKGPEYRTLQSAPGSIVSLIPWGTEVEGVCTSNLAYPLANERLYPWQSRGVSNVSTADSFEIAVDAGQLLVIIMNTSPELKGHG